VRRLTVVLLMAVSLLAVPSIATAGPRVIVTVGTSIEAGVGVQAGESWPSRLDLRTDDTVVDRSLGGGAYTHDNELGDNIRKHVEAAVAELHPDVLILGGPVNDLVSLDLSQIGQLDWAVYGAVSAAYTAGVKRVIVMGILPFTDGGAFTAGWWPTLEQRRTAYNQWAHNMWGANYVDVGWCLHETTTYRADARFFRDGLHPTRVGAALIAECFPLERLG
jgi:lysophospholipase L1-like esterase